MTNENIDLDKIAATLGNCEEEFKAIDEVMKIIKKRKSNEQ